AVRQHEAARARRVAGDLVTLARRRRPDLVRVAEEAPLEPADVDEGAERTKLADRRAARAHHLAREPDVGVGAVRDRAQPRGAQLRDRAAPEAAHDRHLGADAYRLADDRALGARGVVLEGEWMRARDAGEVAELAAERRQHAAVRILDAV